MRNTELGLISERNSKIAFFGDRRSSIEKLQAYFPTYFPDIAFARINQIHGNRVVESIRSENSTTRQDADAHITSETNLALCISTADCVPIMIASTSTPWIAAIHAGWRGVSTKILEATISALGDKKVPLRSLELFFGPHIHQQSYEVDQSVKDLVVNSTHQNNPKHSQELGAGKYLLNLEEVLRSQCLDLGLFESQLNFVNENTRENINYYSVRRDAGTLGRQISFICNVKDGFTTDLPR